MLGDNSGGVSVIVPARNEARHLARLIDAIPPVDQIIVVDGHSVDGTARIAQEHERVSLVLKQQSRGKGSALSLGFQFAEHEYVVMLDSDGSMDPQELPRLVEGLRNGAHLARGSRYLPGGGSDDLTRFRSVGNRILTGLANALYGVHWTDLAYGYAAFRLSALSRLDVLHFDDKLPMRFGASRGMAYGQGFEIESLIFCRSARRGLVVVEVPSHERSRWGGDSNLKAVPDGIRALAAILLERMRSRRRIPQSFRSGASLGKSGS